MIDKPRARAGTDGVWLADGLTKTARIGAQTPDAGLTTTERARFDMAKADSITPEMLRELIDYDPNTGKLYFKERPMSAFPSDRIGKAWNTRCAGKEACSTYSKGYRFGPINGIPCIAHRVAWAVYYGEWPSKDIDHINQVKDDNRIENLRLATDSENLRNIPMFSSNTSGYKGVSKDKRSGRWVARVSTGKEYKWIGSFASKEEASKAYLAAAMNYHGEFFTTRLARVGE